MPILIDGELYLYGYVGGSYWEEGFTSSEVVAALSEVGHSADINVHINSGGGNAFEGSAIHSLLERHKGTVSVFVEGIAASAASAIAMAGDNVTMTAGSIMMIHDPATITFGTALDHAASIVALNSLATSMAELYAEKSGKTSEETRADMQEEIWLTPAEAVAQGYADTQAGKKKVEPTAFDYRVYAKAPKELRSLAASENWSMSTSVKAAKSADQSTTIQKDNHSMADKPTAEQITAAEASGAAKAQERIKLIMQNDEAKGREAQAEMLAYETQMSADDAIKVLSKAPKGSASQTSAEEQYTIDRVQASNLAAPEANKSKNSQIDSSEIYQSRSEAE